MSRSGRGGRKRPTAHGLSTSALRRGRTLRVVKGSVRKPRTAGGTGATGSTSVRTPTVSRQQKQVGGFRTRREAQGALNDALAAFQRGSYLAPSKQTVEEFLEVWLGLRSELAVTAWTNYRDVVHRYIAPHLGSRRLMELTPMDLKAWHGGLLSDGRKDGGPLSARSVQLAHRVFHRALADAVRWHVLPSNPATAARHRGWNAPRCACGVPMRRRASSPPSLTTASPPSGPWRCKTGLRRGGRPAVEGPRPPRLDADGGPAAHDGLPTRSAVATTTAAAVALRAVSRAATSTCMTTRVPAGTSGCRGRRVVAFVRWNVAPSFRGQSVVEPQRDSSGAVGLQPG